MVDALSPAPAASRASSRSATALCRIGRPRRWWLSGLSGLIAIFAAKNVLQSSIYFPEQYQLAHSRSHWATEPRHNQSISTTPTTTTMKTAPNIGVNQTKSMLRSSADKKYSNTKTNRDNELLPIYYIGSSDANPKLDTQSNVVIITRKVDPGQARAMLQDGRLIIRNNVSIVENPILPEDHQSRMQYSFEEAAHLLSHLQSIRRAYQDGHARALFLEDGAIVDTAFWTNWKEIVNLAPPDWKALQWATESPPTLLQGIRLYPAHDAWVTWLPDHIGTHAYTLSRAGMEAILSQTTREATAKEDTGEFVWELNTSQRLLSAHEMIFYQAWPSYTSTYPWIQSPKTINILNASAEETPLKPSWTTTTTTSSVEPPLVPLLARNESVLVLMNIRVDSQATLLLEINRLRVDATILCGWYHPSFSSSSSRSSCDWVVNAVLTDVSLQSLFHEAIADFPPYVHFDERVDNQPFNKFAFLVPLIPRMKDYDLVCIKDNDQRIAGMAWNTLLDKKRNAIMVGPLRQVVEQSLLGSFSFYDRFWFNSAENWKKEHPSWSRDLFTKVQDFELPWLEIHFVVMDGDFAGWFWPMVLPPAYVAQPSNWGINHIWCPAAKRYRNSHYLITTAAATSSSTKKNQSKKKNQKAACVQVPVISLHENSQQIDKGSGKHRKKHKAAGKKASEILFASQNSTLKEWAESELQAFQLMTGLTHQDIGVNCKKLTKKTSVDFVACMQMAMNNTSN